MPTIKLSETFSKEARKMLRKGILTEPQLVKFLCLLAENPRHPSLRCEKLARSNEIWAASITMQYRATWQWLNGDTIVLRTIGDHDPTLNKG